MKVGAGGQRLETERPLQPHSGKATARLLALLPTVDQADHGIGSGKAGSHTGALSPAVERILRSSWVIISPPLFSQDKF